jgi:hypothetical protein
LNIRTGALPALPQPLRLAHRVDFALLPPTLLVAGIMERPVVRVAQRDCPLIANLGSEGTELGKPNVVGMAGGAPTNQTRPGADELQMILISDAPGRHGHGFG